MKLLQQALYTHPWTCRYQGAGQASYKQSLHTLHLALNPKPLPQILKAQLASMIRVGFVFCVFFVGGGGVILVPRPYTLNPEPHTLNPTSQPNTKPPNTCSTKPLVLFPKALNS